MIRFPFAPHHWAARVDLDRGDASVFSHFLTCVIGEGLRKIKFMPSNPSGPRRGSRFCPALNDHISPLVCGQSRISMITCTPDCAFNLFASRNYQQFLPFDAAIIPKVHKFLGPYLGEKRSQKLADECRTHFDADSNLRHTLTYVLIHGLRIAFKETGRDGFSSMGWKNDEVIW